MDQSVHAQADAEVVMYWRPGCPYCWKLRRDLRRADVAVTERNIWEDQDAAAFVRSVAEGNETVPTVVVAGTALVNPSANAVLGRLGRTSTSTPGWWKRLRHRGRSG